MIRVKKSPYMTSEAVKRWKGQPVCVVLKDGSYCAGWITGVDDGHITLSGAESKGKRKAKVSGYIPGMVHGIFGNGEWDFNPFQLYQGTAAASAAPQVPATDAGSAATPEFVTGFSNFMGVMRKTWPDIKFGIGMVQQILPFMKGLGLKF